jgi:hypothetical protein
MLSKLFGMFKSGPDKSAADAPAVIPTPLSRDAFLDAYVAYVQQHAPEIVITRIDEGVGLAWPDGGTMRQFLNNAYTNYRRDAAAIDDIFDTELASAREAGNAAGRAVPFDLALVMPVVKTDAWLATVIEQRGADIDPDHDLVVQPLVPGLLVVYAQNLPSSIEYVKRGDLGDIDETALDARARANLEARLSSIVVHGDGGRYRVGLDGFFDVSLILVAAKWLPALEFPGDPVFALPARDQLMVCGADDAEAVSELRVIAQHIAADSAYAVGGNLLVLRGEALHAI